MGVMWLFILASAFSPAAEGKKGEEKMKIEVGKPAPDFTLKDQDGKEAKLSSFRNKKSVLIAFYPKDFTGG